MTATPQCGAVSTTGATAVVVVCSRPAGHQGAHACDLPSTGRRHVEWTR